MHPIVQSGGKTQRRTVTVTAGAMASLVMTNAPDGSESGWMTVRTPTQLQIVVSLTEPARAAVDMRTP